MEYAATHSLDELLQKALDEIEAVTNSSIGFFHFVHADQKTLTLQAWSTRTLNEFCKAEGKGLHYSIDEAGVWTDCVRERQPVIHNDYHSLPHRKGLPEDHAEVIRELVAPVMKNDLIMAIMGVGNKSQDYNEKDIELVSYLADVVWEITERKKAEQALQESEERLRQIASSLREVIWLRDVQTRQVLYVNPAFEELTGRTCESFYENRDIVIDAIHPDDKDEVIKALGQRFEDIPFAQEHRIIHLDGSVRWVSSRIFPVRNEAGDVYRRTSIMEDITERKRTEEALQESEERFRKVFEEGPLGMAVLSLDDRFIRANEALCSMIRYEEEELIGLTFSKITHPEDVDLGKRQSQELLSGSFPYLQTEKRYVTKEGQTLWINLTASIVYSDEGNPLYKLTMIENITQRKEAEDALRLARFSVDNVADAVYWMDSEAKIVDANEAACHMLGYTHQELTEMSLADIDSGFSFDHWPKTWDQIKNTGKCVLEAQHLTKAGQLIPVEIIANYINFGGRELDCAVVRDITERKKAEETLQMFQYSNDQASVAIYWMDPDTKHLYVNDQACRSLGYTREELLDMYLWDIDPVYPKEQWNSNLERFRENRQGGSEHVETFHRRKDGTIFPVEVFSRHLWLGENEFHVAFVQDITERKQIETERENLIQKLEMQNAELERFAYTVSHDLKSPLITIGGFLGLLEEDALKGDIKKLKEDIQRINNATNKMQKLMDELLELSRIGRLMNPPEDIPFHEIVLDALERLEGQIKAGQVQVEVSGDLPIVHGDRIRLVEVIQNLVGNGIKFMGNQPKPKIEIGVKKEKEEEIFFVRDNGIGISPKYHELIFGLFNKLDQQINGTGIGLALVKRIIEVHGGKIWIESEPGKGATFYFTLPG
jgi:PAS domain S-box-containing protein